MKLLKALVKSKVRPDLVYYISNTEWESDVDILTVYNGIGRSYNILIKRENVLDVSSS